MYLIPIYLTLINFIFSGLFGKYIGTKGVCFITSFFLLVSFISSLFTYYEVVLYSSPTIISISDWFYADLLSVSWLFYFDSLTVTMLLVVTCISFCAHVYSIEYMSSDPHQIRFMSYLSLFTFFMLILVTSGNLLQLFVGWEGVGICSYLLINFWYTRLKANKSAMMAVLTNKIGDIALIISFGLVFLLYRSFNFDVIFSYIHISIFEDNSLMQLNNLIILLFIIGAVGKSAQIGLHMWLPEAMEGPTPVSSLIHAATMVTAGIFLIIRLSYLFELVSNLLLIVVFLGSLTTFFASSIGIMQNDLKKIIAYSTCSQLGYMFFSCGLSGYNYSLFHLFNHAFFKALLFLTAGYIIHSFSNEQDIRKMGILYKFLPFSNIMILYASLSLVAFDFTSGFYSKDKIIELFYNRYTISFIDNLEFNFYVVLQFLSTLAIYCTILYSVKLSIFVFFTANNNSYYSYLNRLNFNYLSYFNFKNTFVNTNIYKIHYGNFYIYFPLLFLFFLSTFSGYLFYDVMIGEGIISWNESFYVSNSINNDLNNNFKVINFEFNEYFKNVLHEWVFYLLISMSFMYFYSKSNFTYLLFISSQFFEYLNKYLIEKYLVIGNVFIDLTSKLIFRFSYFITYILMDKGLVERLGPLNIFKMYQYSLYKIRIYNQFYTTNQFILYLASFYILLILFI